MRWSVGGFLLVLFELLLALNFEHQRFFFVAQNKQIFLFRPSCLEEILKFRTFHLVVANHGTERGPSCTTFHHQMVILKHRCYGRWYPTSVNLVSHNFPFVPCCFGSSMIRAVLPWCFCFIFFTCMCPRPRPRFPFSHLSIIRESKLRGTPMSFQSISKMWSKGRPNFSWYCCSCGE